MDKHDGVSEKDASVSTLRCQSPPPLLQYNLLLPPNTKELNKIARRQWASRVLHDQPCQPTTHLRLNSRMCRNRERREGKSESFIYLFYIQSTIPRTFLSLERKNDNRQLSTTLCCNNNTGTLQAWNKQNVWFVWSNRLDNIIILFSV